MSLLYDLVYNTRVLCSIPLPPTKSSTHPQFTGTLQACQHHALCLNSAACVAIPLQPHQHTAAALLEERLMALEL